MKKALAILLSVITASILFSCKNTDRKEIQTEYYIDACICTSSGENCCVWNDENLKFNAITTEVKKRATLDINKTYKLSFPDGGQNGLTGKYLPEFIYDKTNFEIEMEMNCSPSSAEYGTWGTAILTPLQPCENKLLKIIFWDAPGWVEKPNRCFEMTINITIND